MVYRQSLPPTRKRRFLSNRRLWLWIVLVLVAGGLVLLILELTDTTHLLHNKPPTYTSPTAGPATKGIPEAGKQAAASSSNDQTTPESGQNEQIKHPNSETPAASTLKEPSGNFINNHRPSGNEQMESICNTSTGATCAISFTKDGVTKSLPGQKTDLGGATYWAWKINDLGLNAGSWTITATASLNSQTVTSTDALKLEVSP